MIIIRLLLTWYSANPFPISSYVIDGENRSPYVTDGGKRIWIPGIQNFSVINIKAIINDKFYLALNELDIFKPCLGANIFFHVERESRKDLRSRLTHPIRYSVVSSAKAAFITNIDTIMCMKYVMYTMRI